jgi:hypothetical protein
VFHLRPRPELSKSLQQCAQGVRAPVLFGNVFFLAAWPRLDLNSIIHRKRLMTKQILTSLCSYWAVSKFVS